MASQNLVDDCSIRGTQQFQLERMEVGVEGITLNYEPLTTGVTSTTAGGAAADPQVSVCVVRPWILQQGCRMLPDGAASGGCGVLARARVHSETNGPPSCRVTHEVRRRASRCCPARDKWAFVLRGKSREVTAALESAASELSDGPWPPEAEVANV